MDYKQICFYIIIVLLASSSCFITYILITVPLPSIYKFRFINFIIQHLLGLMVFFKRRLFCVQQDTPNHLLWMIGFTGLNFFNFIAIQLFGLLDGKLNEQIRVYKMDMSFIVLSYFHLYYQTNIYFGVFCLFSIAMAIVYWLNQRRHAHQMQQVLQELQSQKYQVDKKNQNQQTSCSICLGQFQKNQGVYKLVCGHIFHKQCLKDWFKQKLSCPMCRDDVARGIRHQQYEQQVAYEG